MESNEEFFNWLKEHNASFDSIDIKKITLYDRGIVSCGVIASGTPLLCIPKDLIITPELGKATPIGQKIIQAGITLHWDHLFFITLFLLTEKHNKKSIWKPYLNMYPATVNSFPLFYTNSEKELLKATSMLDYIDKEFKERKEEYERIIKIVPEFEEFSFDEYVKCRVIVTSRVFHTNIHGVPSYLIVPLAGFFYVIKGKICLIILRIVRQHGSIQIQMKHS